MESRSHEDLLEFVQAHTELVAPPGCPEIKLHTATAMTPLWQASERFLPGVAVQPPYWSLAWAGSQGLARHIFENKWLVRGRQVLDFAAGSGIAGIAAAIIGAKTVDAYDADPLARAAIALNARSNAMAVSVVADDPAAADGHASWEVVLVGDAGYEVATAERHLPWLRKLGAEGVLVLLADPGGAYGSVKGVIHLADYEIPTGHDAADPAMREVAIYRMGS